MTQTQMHPDSQKWERLAVNGTARALDQRAGKPTGRDVLILTAALLPLAMYSGWVLTVLWGWFIVPAFGLPAMGLGTAMGIELIVTVLRPPRSSKPGTDAGKIICDVICFNTFILGLGWVLRVLFMR